MKNLVDISVRTLFRAAPAALFRLVGADLLSSHLPTPLDTSIALPELYADHVFRTEDESGPWALYVEYQLAPNARAASTWVLKSAALARQLDMRVVLVVVYLKQGRRKSFPDRVDVRAGGLVNSHRFPVIRLWEHAERIRAGELVELAPLLLLCDERDPGEVLREERKLIRSARLPRRVEAALLSSAFLIGLRYTTRSVLEAVFGEDYAMLKSTDILAEWIAEGRMEGQIEGRMEGQIEGRMEGRGEEARRMALLVLERRFGAVPTWAEQRVRELSADECEALAERAFSVESIADLLD